MRHPTELSSDIVLANFGKCMRFLITFVWVGWLGWLAGWLAGWDGSLAGWLAGWLTGRLAGSFAPWQPASASKRRPYARALRVCRRDSPKLEERA